MENLMSVASYVFNRYQETMGEKIDEMKLHKLLYFAQRESIIQRNEPLFAEVFYDIIFNQNFYHSICSSFYIDN